jgi:intein/homing endonuclease
MSVARSLDQNFFKKWSPDMAYVLGFFAADGSMLKNTRGAHFIEFTITDRIVLDHIQRVSSSNHHISERVSRNKKWKPQYRLQVGSKEWFADLTALGFTQKKSASLSFPKVPKRFLGDFVRGYFDGDGCVHFKEYWSGIRNRKIWVFSTLFTSGSRGFLESLHSLLKANGVRGGRIAEKERGFELVFSRRDSLALYEFMYHTTDASPLFLPRKREKLEEAIQVLGLE